MNFISEIKQVSSKKTCTAQECVRSSRTAKSSYCDMHKCDNPICCNPNHLQVGTRELNLQDKIEKQRQAKGSTHGKAKLDEKLVVNLREKYNSGYTIRELLPSARGVSYRVLWCALVGRTWRHI